MKEKASRQEANAQHSMRKPTKAQEQEALKNFQEAERIGLEFRAQVLNMGRFFEETVEIFGDGWIPGQWPYCTLGEWCLEIWQGGAWKRLQELKESISGIGLESALQAHILANIRKMEDALRIHECLLRVLRLTLRDDPTVQDDGRNLPPEGFNFKLVRDRTRWAILQMERPPVSIYDLSQQAGIDPMSAVDLFRCDDEVLTTPQGDLSGATAR